MDLLELLEKTFSTEKPDLQPLRKLLLALIEDGQHHLGHEKGPPIVGVHPCARKGSCSKGKEYVYSVAILAQAKSALHYLQICVHSTR